MSGFSYQLPKSPYPNEPCPVAILNLLQTAEKKEAVQTWLDAFQKPASAEQEAWVAYSLPFSAFLWEVVGDKKATKDVRDLAEECVVAQEACLRPFATREWLENGVYAALRGGAKPEQKLLALKVLQNRVRMVETMVGENGDISTWDCAKAEDEAYVRAVSNEMDKLMQPVVDLLNDSKKPVKAAAKETLRKLVWCCFNKDLKDGGFLDYVVKANEGDMQTVVPDCIEKLAGCIFVQRVEAPALSVMTPVLWRGLNQKKDATVRRTCKIIDNMCKLVENARDAYPLMAKILPLTITRLETVSDPEARTIVESAVDKMEKLAQKLARLEGKNYDRSEVKELATGRDHSFFHVEDTLKNVHMALQKVPIGQNIASKAKVLAAHPAFGDHRPAALRRALEKKGEPKSTASAASAGGSGKQRKSKKGSQRGQSPEKAAGGQADCQQACDCLLTLYVADVAQSILQSGNNSQKFDPAIWNAELKNFMAEAEVKKMYSVFQLAQSGRAGKGAGAAEDEYKEAGGENLYEGSFTLAYGTQILLRETKLLVKKNAFYGLLGGNGCGKTTLMQAIAEERIEGFPKKDELRTTLVQHEIVEREIGKRPDGQPMLNTDLSGADWVVDVCNNVHKVLPPITKQQAEEAMFKTGFAVAGKMNAAAKTGGTAKRAADASKPMTTYSGGWKVKMQLVAASLVNADILMLDEPTGHMDVKNIAWLKEWLKSFKGSIIVTSHDTPFLNEMCSHIIFFTSEFKLNQFKGAEPLGSTLTQFSKKHPEVAESFFKLESKKLVFNFPPPGPLDGVKSRGRAILKMNNVNFKYDAENKSAPWIVENITLQMSLASRVAVVGPNGSGKTTAIKLLLGEMKPAQGTVFRHTGSRIAHVAQQCLHHLEKHLEKTPAQYIMWRFQGMDDKESLENANKELNQDEEVLRKVKWCVDMHSGLVRKVEPGQEKVDRVVVPESILNRRKNKEKKYEYEVKWAGRSVEQSTWVVRDTMVQMGFEKMVCAEDEKQAAAQGLMLRPLTQPSVEQHLAAFGMSVEEASHTPINKLAGGQKVKVVLGAAMWLNPHIIVLDEPTNYLDRDALGALTQGLKNYGGGVVIISHNEDFANSVATEKWIMNEGRLKQEGGPPEDDADFSANLNHLEEIVDGAGNVVQVNKHKNQTAKDLKKALRELEKQMKDDKTGKNKLSDDFRWQIQDKVEEIKGQLGVPSASPIVRLTGTAA